MNRNQMDTLAKLGLIITNIEYENEQVNIDGLRGADRDAKMPLKTRGEFVVDESRFMPMLHLVELVDMICESKNPMVNEQFNHLVTLLNLTKESKNG